MSVGSIHEERLLDDAVKGDVEAFMALLDLYDGQLRAYVYGMVGDAHRMDDVLQETTMKTYGSPRCVQQELVLQNVDLPDRP